MKESDYIRAADLTKVRIMQSILSRLTPGVGVIDQGGYETIAQTLYSWQRKMEKAGITSV